MATATTDGDEEDKQEGDSEEKKSRGNVGRSRQYEKKLQSAGAEAGSISDTKSNTMRLSDVIEMRGVGTPIGDGEYSVRRRRRGRRGDASGINKTGKGNK